MSLIDTETSHHVSDLYTGLVKLLWEENFFDKCQSKKASPFDSDRRYKHHIDALWLQRHFQLGNSIKVADKTSVVASCATRI